MPSPYGEAGGGSSDNAWHAAWHLMVETHPAGTQLGPAWEVSPVWGQVPTHLHIWGASSAVVPKILGQGWPGGRGRASKSH